MNIIAFSIFLYSVASDISLPESCIGYTESYSQFQYIVGLTFTMGFASVWFYLAITLRAALECIHHDALAVVF